MRSARRRDDRARPGSGLGWFVRRTHGIGWRPVSWQGGVVIAIAVGALLAGNALVGGGAARVLVFVVVIALLLLVQWLTERRETDGVAGPGPGGPAPGGSASPTRRPQRAPLRLGPTGIPASAAAVEVDRLTKRFGDRLAVDDVSFAVGQGEVFGFLGPNGAGKTTTVRMLGTLIEPSSGSATIAGLRLNAANAVQIRQRVAIMPEAPGLYLRLTVEENLRFFAGLYGLREPRARIETGLAAVRLGDRRADPCGSLSKGLRQRVALARALLGEPRVLFLDEPTSGLDPVAAREVHELIDGLRRQGVTIFLTTHRLEEAERLCDRVAILNSSLRALGRPDELREHFFQRSLAVRTRAPLPDPALVFDGLPAVEGWRAEPSGGPPQDGGGWRYLLSVGDPSLAAPALTRALVAAGADVLSIGESRHSLEEVYLELIEDDVEAGRR